MALLLKLALSAFGWLKTAFTFVAQLFVKYPMPCVIVVLCGLLWFEHSRVNTAKAELQQVCEAIGDTTHCLQAAKNLVLSQKAYKTAFTTAADNFNKAQAANEATTKALDAAVAANEANLKTKADAEQRAKQALARLAQTTRQLKHLEDTIYATDPTCKAWGDVPVCPAVAQFLRDQAGPAAAGSPGGYTGQDGNGQGVALCAVAGTSHGIAGYP